MKVKGRLLVIWKGKRGDGGGLENKGMKIIKVRYMYIWKHHNKTFYFVELINTNNFFLKIKKVEVGRDWYVPLKWD
jgi:hypothetical protein